MDGKYCDIKVLLKQNWLSRSIAQFAKYVYDEGKEMEIKILIMYQLFTWVYYLCHSVVAFCKVWSC